MRTQIMLRIAVIIAGQNAVADRSARFHLVTWR
jgi:hypothetical protein